MTRTTQLALLVLCFAALALAKKHSLVEKAGSSKHIKEWQPLPTKPHHDESITLGFALKQKNLDQLEETFNRVSDPAHADFGKHLTTQQLADMVGASDDTIDDVKKWLHKHDAKSIKVSNTRDYIWATLTARDIEKLLNIEMNVYLHQSTKLSKNAYISRSVDSPYVPSEFADQIDFVSGVWHFPSTKSLFKNVKDNLVEKAMSNRAAAEESDSVVVIPSILQSAGAPEGISIYFEPVCSTGNTSESLQPCTDFNNPIVTYNVTTWQLDYTNKLVVKSQILTSSAVNCTIEESLFGDLLYCIATAGNLLDDSYVNATFSYCFQDKTCTETGTAAGFGVGLPIVPSALHTPTDVRSHYGVPASLVGGNAKNSQAVAAFIYQFFSPADLALFFKEVGLPQYTVQKVIGPNNPPFPGVEASLDIQYIMGVAQGVNTWFWSMGGSSWIAEWGQAVLNTPNAPWVHSISYGEGESYVTASYIARSEAELQKLGAAGHSVMVASGDDGSGDDCDVYAPDWPTSSPSVTSVGATRITRGATPACQANPAGSGCSTVGDVSAAGDLGLFWTTGGGFSNAYPKRPSWQDAAVSNYLKKATLPPSTSFNNTGRAYPDVSAVGHNLVVVDAGVAQPIDGTSAASPIFAALISLLNEERIAAGKSSLGFLNKWIYSIGSTAFNDVTVGDTTFCEQGQCCPTPSYTAIAGWDAASGWGAPNFPVLLKEALKLA